MITVLNRLVDLVEESLTEELDVASLATGLGTTEYHVRRMFSSLAGMPLSEYVRRRRMTVAAADVVAGDDLLGVAVRYGYGSVEAFGRAFRSVHGVGLGDVRREGAFRLVGHAVRVPLIHEGVNPHIQAHVTSIPAEEHARLKSLGNAEPSGLLQVSDDVDPDATEGSELTYLHGVAVTADTTTPEGLDVIEVPAGTWAAFRAEGPYPAVLQATWAATATEWLPSNPWRLRPGPSIVAVLDRAEDFSEATCELWLPLERA